MAGRDRGADVSGARPALGVADWDTGYVDSAGERIYWESGGAGVPIVICHGAGSNHLSFYQQMAGLSPHARIVLWDQRGYGNSTLRTGRFGIDLAAADLSAVLDGLGLGPTRIHLVGQALGALVAARWAVAHPDRVASLALWDGPFGVSADGRDLVWTLPPGDRGVEATMVDRRVGWTRAVGEAFSATDPTGTYLYQSIQGLGNVKPTYSQLFTAAQESPVPLAGLAALDVAILVGRGERDHVADPDSYRALAARIPGSVEVVLPGCGHSPYFESAPAWNAALLRHVGTAGGEPVRGRS